MSVELLRLRLWELGRLRESWEAHIDPEDGKSMRSALLGAVEAQGVDGDPVDALGRFQLEWQGRTGGWRSFRAGR